MNFVFVICGRDVIYVVNIESVLFMCYMFYSFYVIFFVRVVVIDYLNVSLIEIVDDIIDCYGLLIVWGYSVEKCFVIRKV